MRGKIEFQGTQVTISLAIKRLELVCANRGMRDRGGLPIFIGTKRIKAFTFPPGTCFSDKGEYWTAYFTSKSGRRREIDIFFEDDHA